MPIPSDLAPRSYERALHDALRFDPGVAPAGEMRDPDPLRSARTGRLVFSTVAAPSKPRIASE